MASWAGSTFSALSNRNFRILWTGTSLAFVAFFMSLAVQAVVAFDLAGNNTAVGFVVFGQGIAQLLLGPLGGALADRLSKKFVILACQVTITLCFFSLGLLIATDHITVLYLTIGSFVIGMAFSFLGPSRQAFMVELVDPARRGNAVALSQVALNASRIVGPGIGGALIAVEFLGSAGAYFAMTALYVGAIVTTAMLPQSRKPDTSHGRSVLADIASGVSYVAHTPKLRLLVLSYVLVITFGFSYTSVLPGLVENELGRKASSITILLLVNAAGGLSASLGVAGLADSARARTVYTAMCLIFGVTLLLSGLAPNFWLLGGMMFLLGLGAGGFQTLNGAIVSQTTAPEYFGRVISLTFLAFAVSSIFALPVGYLADAIGERTTLVVTGSAVCGITVAFYLLERGEDARARREQLPLGAPGR